MDKGLMKLAALSGLIFAIPLQAAPISLSFEGVFTSVVRTVDCPAPEADCSIYNVTESVNVPVTGTLSFEFQPPQEPSLYESHYTDPVSGRPVGFYSSVQTIEWFETLTTDFDHPVLVPQEVALANPISAQYWNENLEWPSTRYSELHQASLFGSLSQYDDSGEPIWMQSSWGVGASQNWYVTDGPPYENIQYSSSLLLGGPTGFQLTPLNMGSTLDNESFLGLLSSAMSCGYCLTVSGINGTYDTHVTGLLEQNIFSGAARLVAIDGVPVSVPEPGTVALLVVGLIATGCASRRNPRCQVS